MTFNQWTPLSKRKVPKSKYGRVRMPLAPPSLLSSTSSPWRSSCSVLNIPYPPAISQIPIFQPDPSLQVHKYVSTSYLISPRGCLRTTLNTNCPNRTQFSPWYPSPYRNLLLIPGLPIKINGTAFQRILQALRLQIIF